MRHLVLAVILAMAAYRYLFTGEGPATLPPDRDSRLVFCEHIRGVHSLGGGSPRQKEKQKQLVDTNHAHIVTASMGLHLQDVELQKSCSNAICAMVLFNEYSSTIAAEAGALEAMYNAVTEHSHNADIHEFGAGAIGCIMDEVVDNRRRGAKLGVIGYAIDAWKLHSNRSDALFGLSCTLCAVNYDIVENKWKTIRLGWLPLGLQAIHNHPESNTRVREEVMQVIQSLVNRPCVLEVHEELVSAGIIDAIVLVLKENSEHLSTMANLCRAVEGLARTSPKHNELMGDAGVVELVVAQVGWDRGKGWAAYVDVDGLAVMALNALSANAENLKRMTEAGLKARIVKAMAANSENGALSHHGNALLDRLRAAV